MTTSRYVCRPSSGVLRIAIVGSGPGGFFTAQRLIKVSDSSLSTLLHRIAVPY